MRDNIWIKVFVILMVVLFILPTGDIRQVRLDRTYEGPSKEFKLGTDNLGRDFYSLMVEGGKRTALVTVIASGISLAIGLISGMLAGYYEGRVEQVVQFFTDLLMVVPSFISSLIFTSLFGLTPVKAGVMLGITGSVLFTQQTKALTKRIKKEDFFQNEKILGISERKLVFKHILPNIIDPILTSFGNNAGNVIISYSSLAFIGLGTDVTKPDWGAMLYQYRIYIIEHPRLIIWPTVGIFVLSMIFHLAFDSNRGKKKRGNIYG